MTQYWRDQYDYVLTWDWASPTAARASTTIADLSMFTTTELLFQVETQRLSRLTTTHIYSPIRSEIVPLACYRGEYASHSFGASRRITDKRRVQHVVIVAVWAQR